MAKRPASSVSTDPPKRRATSTSARSTPNSVSKSTNSSSTQEGSLSQESETKSPSPSPSPSTSTSASRSSSSNSSASATTSEEDTGDNVAKHPIPREPTTKLSIGIGAAARASTAPLRLDIDKCGLPSPATLGRSHNSTPVPSPSSSKHLQHLLSGSKDPSRPSDSFPFFLNGDVVIKSVLGSLPILYQLHSSVLRRHSPWFARTMRPGVGEENYAWFLFEFEEIDGKTKLIRRHAEGDRSRFANDYQPEGLPEVEIKVEDTNDDVAATPSLASAKPSSAAYGTKPNPRIAGYRQVLAAFYSIPPQISTAHVETTLVQAEELIKIATELQCQHLLRDHLGNVLSQYRQKLYLAIKKDPPRWIRLAIALENRLIYTESLIHMVGAHPHWPWITSRTTLPEGIQTLIKNKSQEITQARFEIERALLLITLPYGKKHKILDPTNRAETETWMTVQAFRDQVAKRISAIDRHKQASLHRGTFHRGIKKGTLPWMETEHMREVCKKIMPLHWKELNEELVLLREHAAKVVGELAANELMIDPDENGVNYLTCAKVTSEEVPWFTNGERSA